MNNLLHIIFILAFSFNALAQCSILRPEDILPETTTSVSLTVENLTASGLGADQSICRVYLEFEHGRLENLRFNLISPSGQTLRLIGPGTQNGAFTPNINWNVSFLPCAFPVAPDAGYADIWDSGQTWSAFDRLTGSYHPNEGCLEEFNTGSANGEWTLEIINQGTNTGKLIYFEIEFCEPDGIQCETCNPVAGSFEEDFMIACEADPFFDNRIPGFEMEPVVAGDDWFSYVLTQDQGPNLFSFNQPPLSQFDAGEYTLCAIVGDVNLSIEAQFTNTLAELRDFDRQHACIELTENCITIEILPIQDLREEAHIICEGDSVITLGSTFRAALDTIIYSDDLGLAPCERATHLVITETQIESDLKAPASDLLCGQTILLDALGSSSTGGALDFNWSTFDGTVVSGVGPIAQVSSAGTYYLELESDGCIALDSVVIQGTSDLEITREVLPRRCASDSFLVVLAVNGILPSGFDFILESLTNALGPVDHPPLNRDTLVIADPGEYFLRTTYGSCFSEDTILLSDSLFDIELELEASDTITCTNTDIELLINSNVINPSYSFDGPEDIPDGVINPTITTAGIYSVSVTDENNCLTSAQVEVFSNGDFPQLEVESVEQDCDEQMDIPLVATVSAALDSLVWLGPMGEKYYDQGAMVSDTGEYIVTAFGSNGCRTIDTLSYTIDRTPVIVEFINVVIECGGDSILLSDSFDSFTSLESIWTETSGTILATGSEIYFSQPGSYILSSSNADGCIAQKQIEIEDRSEDLGLDEIELVIENEDCESLFQVSTEGPLGSISSLLVNNVNQDISSPLELLSGEYQFIITDTNGCTREEVLTLESGANAPQIDLGPDVTINLGESYELQGLPTDPPADWEYEWSEPSILSCTACLDPTVTPQESMALVLSVSDAEGCGTSDTVIITVISETPNQGGFYIPTIFSPGSDLGDDQLIIGLDTTSIKEMEFYLYDRWGNLMVESVIADPDQAEIVVWDGRFNGKSVNSGSYTYMATFLYMSSKRQNVLGQICLLRK